MVAEPSEDGGGTGAEAGAATDEVWPGSPMSLMLLLQATLSSTPCQQQYLCYEVAKMRCRRC